MRLDAVDESEQLEGTRGRILEELAVAPRTARDLSLKLGIQESAARGHLDRMEERGLVVPTFRREGVGRPRKRYALTGTAQELFPKKYDLILDTVVDELLAREGEGYVSALFADAAERMAREVVKDVPRSGTPTERAESVVRSLNRLGFRCSTDHASDGSTARTASSATVPSAIRSCCAKCSTSISPRRSSVTQGWT